MHHRVSLAPDRSRAFTIIEVLVVVSIISLLIGILLPALGKAREQARLTQSVANLSEIGNAHAIYGAEWNDRQVTWINDNISLYGSSASAAFNNFPGVHPPMEVGLDQNGNFWQLSLDRVASPINFTPPAEGWGAHRRTNIKAFNNYLSGRFYDPVFWAPKDVMAISAIGECWNHHADVCTQIGTFVGYPTSYSYSPAAMFNPAVMGYGNDGAFQDPWDLPAGHRSPSSSACTFPTLKTRVLEHHWLNGNPPHPCNGVYAGFGPFDGCQPYFFNQGWNSSPITLFFDGHVEPLGVREAIEADERAMNQTGVGTWSRDTPLGDYYHETAYEQFSVTTQSSFHILTTYGIKGKDKDAR